MNFDLSETQQLFQSTVERFTRNIDVAARCEIRSLDHSYDRSRWSELCDLGLLALVPKADQGGLEGSTVDLSVIAQALGNNNAIDPWLENGFFPVSLLSNANHDELLEQILDGSIIGAVGFSEPGTRYQLMPQHTVARTVDDGFRLSGEKNFVLGGALADYFFVTATHNNNFAMFSVPVELPGIHTQAYRVADGSICAKIAFQDLHLPENAVLNLNFEQFKNTITEVCLLACSEMLGLSQHVFDQTLDYVKQRKQFDVPISSFQVIQHGLVDCYSELEQMRGLMLRTLLIDQSSSEQWHAEVMGAKSFISEGAMMIAERAVQYHGAMGTTNEVSIGHAMKRIILLARLFGDASQHLNDYMEFI